jgi:hypothetical protein
VQAADAPSQPGAAAPEVAAVVRGAGKEATVQVWDVNGDGAKDAVLSDTATGAKSALLNRGDDAKPQLSTDAISISAPTSEDLNSLAVHGKQTGRSFLATDVDGDGLRQLAVRRDTGEWVSLGGSQDTPGVKPIDEAEKRFEAFVMQMMRWLPATLQVRGLWGAESGTDFDDWADEMDDAAYGVPGGLDTATPSLGALVPTSSAFALLWAFMASESESFDKDEDSESDDEPPQAAPEPLRHAPLQDKRDERA